MYSYRITSLKKSETEFEKFVSMTVDNLGHYIIVCSSMSSEAITKDLIWLQVSPESGAIHVLARRMIGEDYAYMSERRSLVFAGYYNHLPAVFSCERLGKGRLFSYYYTGKEIINFIQPIEKLPKDENFRLYTKNGFMFVLDISG